MADNLFLKYGIKHTLHGCFDILDSLINYLIQTDIHAFSFGCCLCGCVRTYIEADDNCGGCACQHNVGFVDGTYTAMDAFYHNFFVGKLKQTLLNGFHTTLNVSLYNQVQFL